MQRFSGAADQTLYDSILSGEYKTEQKVVIGSTEIGADSILSMKLDTVLYDDYSIGNVISSMATIELTGVRSVTLGATITIKQRIKNASNASAWFNRATLFICKVQKDKLADKTTITAYDAIFKAGKAYTSWTPKTSKAAVNAIAAEIGAGVESETALWLTNYPFDINYIPSLGENGTTRQDLLGYIAAYYGANWTINANGDLRLITIALPAETGYLVTERGAAIVFGEDRILI